MSGVNSQLPVFVPRKILPGEKTRGLRPQLSVEIAGAFLAAGLIAGLRVVLGA